MGEVFGAATISSGYKGTFIVTVGRQPNGVPAALFAAH
jgi:hypothetical protein